MPSTGVGRGFGALDVRSGSFLWFGLALLRGVVEAVHGAALQGDPVRVVDQPEAGAAAAPEEGALT